MHNMFGVESIAQPIASRTSQRLLRKREEGLSSPVEQSSPLREDNRFDDLSLNRLEADRLESFTFERFLSVGIVIW